MTLKDRSSKAEEKEETGGGRERSLLGRRTLTKIDKTEGVQSEKGLTGDVERALVSIGSKTKEETETKTGAAAQSEDRVVVEAAGRQIENIGQEKYRRRLCYTNPPAKSILAFILFI